jgi:acyl-CoA synthetase (AMP-forming)/AMP-acid ligase II
MSELAEKSFYIPPSNTIRGLIDKHAKEQAERMFILFPESGIELNYRQLQARVDEYGRYFHALGLVKGDTISFMMGNGPTSLELFLAALYSGNISSPLNPAAGQEQIEYVLDHSDTKIVFVSEDYQAQVTSAAAKLSRDIQIIISDIDTGPKWPVQPAVDRAVVGLSANDDALLMYTSGTTGKPKGVVLTHNNLLAGGMNTARAHELTADDRALCVLPLCHINAQCSTVMGPLVSAGSVVMPHGFSVSAFWNWIIDYRVSWFSVVPTIISYLIHQEIESIATVNLKEALSHVRFGRSASAPLAPSLHELFEEKFGLSIVETMGLTETSAQILSNPMPPKKGKYGSPGISFGTEIKIIDKQGNTQAIGKEGELMIRGECVMKEYYKNPTVTAETIIEGGWLHTGDLATQDEDGFVFITGRLKELIIKCGENIAPREIDDVLYSHPSILEAGAVGIDDINFGQEVIACVVVKKNQQISEQELTDFCLSKLGKLKTPKHIFFFDDLPKGPSGKVQRLKLVDQLKEKSLI